MTSPMHQLDSITNRKPPPKFEIRALFRHVLVYTHIKKKTHNIVKSIHSSLRSESKNEFLFLKNRFNSLYITFIVIQ
ncbi:hypothetical protein FWK35_00014997 [Aphis craccivora]|uniref:Uncharacterized protein n=1 Tax=Aphis craccivora TaxID=307492 RepID=A0A6G0YSI6_APHCR|nr:hypothetical protein FWK35_00014997 [Aphis craccivora]